jgi:hypothetical protein
MSSTKIDVAVIGTSAVQKHRVAASATRFYAGEPIMFAGTYTSGVASVNTVVVLTDGKPVIGTDNFVGISAQDAPVGTDTTVDADWVDVIELLPNFTRMRAKAKTTGNVDTLSELVGVLWDLVLFDLTLTVYTIDETAAADTSGLTIKGGIWEQGLVDVTVDPRAMRADIT